MLMKRCQLRVTCFNFIFRAHSSRWLLQQVSYFSSLFLQPKPVHDTTGSICQICGERVGVTEEGELFVACNECAFPVCRPCFEYERKDGNQACPQCKTRYKRLKGESCFCWNLIEILTWRKTLPMYRKSIAISAAMYENTHISEWAI